MNMHKKGFVYKWQSLCPKTFPQNTSGSRKHADDLELYGFLKSKSFRASIGTRGSLLKGIPETLVGKKDSPLASEIFPDNFDLLFSRVVIFFSIRLFRHESLGIFEWLQNILTYSIQILFKPNT